MDLIKALDWGYEKALEEVRGLGHEVKPERVESNLLIFVGERLKNALKPYTNCWRRAALITGYALAGNLPFKYFFPFIVLKLQKAK